MSRAPYARSPAPTPSPDLRARVLAAARAEPSPTRPQARRAAIAAVALGFALTLALFAAFGGPDVTRRPPALVALSGAAWAILAYVATALAVGRGGSALGRPRAVLAAVAVVTAPLLFACFAVLARAAFPGVVIVASARVDRACFVATTVLALAPVVAFAFARRGSDPVHPRATGAALGAAGGAWGGVLIDLHCPATSLAHVAFAHLGPIVLFSLLGLLLGRRVLGLRAS